MQRYKILLFIYLLFSLSTPGLSQAPSIEWQHSYGGMNQDWANEILITIDGGYCIIGGTYSNNGNVLGNNGLVDAWVLKIDSLGNVDYQNCIGGSNVDDGITVLQSYDGSLLLGCVTTSSDSDIVNYHGGGDCLIGKINNNGNAIWKKSFGGTGAEYSRSIIQTINHCYVLAAITSSNDGDITFNHGGNDYWLVMIDSTGNILWEKTYGGSLQDEPESLIQTADGGFLIAGRTNSLNGDVNGYHGGCCWDFWIVKTDSIGNLQWQKCIGGSDYDEAYSIIETTDGNYMVAGRSKSSNGDKLTAYGNYDYWIVKLNTNGSILWEKTYGGTSADEAMAIQQTLDGGFIIAGSTASNNIDVTGNNGGWDYWIIKVDSSGLLEWQKSLGGSSNDMSFSMKQTFDEGFIIAGKSLSNDGDVTGNQGNVDFWVVKLGPAPVGINEPQQISFSCSPNPFHSSIIVSAKQDVTLLYIYNISGQLVYSKPFVNNVEINLSFLSSSLYILELHDNNGNSARQKLIKW